MIWLRLRHSPRGGAGGPPFAISSRRVRLRTLPAGHLVGWVSMISLDVLIGSSVSSVAAAAPSLSSAAAARNACAVSVAHRLFLAHLELERLSGESDNVAKVGILVEADLGRAVAPVAFVADVPSNIPLVVQRFDRDIEAES